MNRKPLHTLTTLIGIVLIAVLAAGCTLPIPQLGGQPTQQTSGATPDTLYTQAVLTVAAQLTQAAEAAGTSEPSGATPEAPQATATQPPAPQATATKAAPTTTLTQPTKAPTSAATQAPAATATLASSDPRAGLGEPVLRDTFENADNWPFEEDTHSNMEVNDNRLEMTAFKADGFDSWALTWPNPTDFYAEMTVTSTKCSGLDRYGIIFRAPQKANKGYLFGISCDGKYSLRLWDGKKFTNLVEWTSRPEQPHRGEGCWRYVLAVRQRQPAEDRNR
jgi:hypothetical protein